MWVPNLPTVVLSAMAATAGGACIFKDLYSGSPYDRDVRAEGKVAIVTGANSGIGHQTVWELANRGAKVFMACRDMSRCEEARRSIVKETGNKYVYCRPCDLASISSIKQFVERFKSEEPTLHYLVNNAGVMGVEKGVTRDGFETHLGVNHLGHFVLTNLLLDTLKESSPSRVVIVSASAHFKGTIHKDDLNLTQNYDPTVAYNQSKLANVLFARELGARLLNSKVSVVAVDPGLTDTALTRHLPMAKSVTRYLVYPLFWPFMKTPRLGAQAALHACLDHQAGRSAGDYYVDMKKSEPSAEAQDYELSQWLWQVSDKWTKSRLKHCEEVAA